jgi:hypothetical protein
MLPPTLDTLVAVLVERGKVLPQLPVGLRHIAEVRNGSKLRGQRFQGVNMKLILM